MWTVIAFFAGAISWEIVRVQIPVWRAKVKAKIAAKLEDDK